MSGTSLGVVLAYNLMGLLALGLATKGNCIWSRAGIYLILLLFTLVCLSSLDNLLMR